MRLFAVAVVTLAIVIPAVAQEQQAPAEGTLKVSEIAVCPRVENRECPDAASSFSAEVGTLTCLTRVEGSAGQTTVTHVWLKDGTEMRRVELPIRSSSWRTWSQKNVSAGSWMVKVLDASGNEIGSTSFTVGS